MKISIIVPDSKVNINGEAYTVTLPDSTPADLHAVQWYAGDAGQGYGELEYRERNEPATDATFDVAPFVAAWETAKAAADDTASA